MAQVPASLCLCPACFSPTQAPSRLLRPVHPTPAAPHQGPCPDSDNPRPSAQQDKAGGRAWYGPSFSPALLSKGTEQVRCIFLPTGFIPPSPGARPSLAHSGFSITICFLLQPVMRSPLGHLSSRSSGRRLSIIPPLCRPFPLRASPRDALKFARVLLKPNPGFWLQTCRWPVLSTSWIHGAASGVQAALASLPSGVALGSRDICHHWASSATSHRASPL